MVTWVKKIWVWICNKVCVTTYILAPQDNEQRKAQEERALKRKQQQEKELARRKSAGENGNNSKNSLQSKFTHITETVSATITTFPMLAVHLWYNYT